MKRTIYLILSKFLLIGLIGLIFTIALTGCPNDSNDSPALSDWEGSWNAYHGYLDRPAIQAVIQQFYDAMPAEDKALYTFDLFVAGIKSTSLTPFKSFVIEDNTLTLYDTMQESENSTGMEMDKITYTFSKTIQDTITWGDDVENMEWYAFEGNKEGNYKYLLLEAASRSNSDSALKFHIRYGSKSFEDLTAKDGDNYSYWYPTILSYDTTQEQLINFMLEDD